MSNDYKPSGVATPSIYTKFSGGNVNANVIAIITCPKSTNIFVVLANGRLISYSKTLGSETLIGTVAGSNAGGAAYYNNYIYIFGTGASKNDVSRYGPFDASPVITDGVWTGATLGSQTALTNTTYPSIRNGYTPNHWAAFHGDNCLYFCDFANGYGLIHRIHTKKGTYEGDTNETANPSMYGALTLPLGYYPTAIASYGLSIAITAIQTTSYEMNQGNAALFLWNTGQISSIGPDQQVNLPDSYASALVVRNGFLHIFTGSAQGGEIRISTYSGGDTVLEATDISEGIPPMAGAVDVDGRRLLFGTYCYEPLETACVYAVGSEVSSKDDIQNIATVGSQLAAQSAMVYAIKVVEQQLSHETNPQIIIAAQDTTSGYGIYKKTSGGNLQSVLTLPSVTVGAGFVVTKMRIPLASAVTSGTVITPVITYDDINSVPLTAISNSTYPAASKVIYRAQEMPDRGVNQFKLSLQWAGATADTSVGFPIELELDVDDDEKN